MLEQNQSDFNKKEVRTSLLEERLARLRQSVKMGNKRNIEILFKFANEGNKAAYRILESELTEPNAHSSLINYLLVHVRGNDCVWALLCHGVTNGPIELLMKLLDILKQALTIMPYQDLTTLTSTQREMLAEQFFLRLSTENKPLESTGLADDKNISIMKLATSAYIILRHIIANGDRATIGALLKETASTEVGLLAGGLLKQGIMRCCNDIRCEASTIITLFDISNDISDDTRFIARDLLTWAYKHHPMIMTFAAGTDERALLFISRGPQEVTPKLVDLLLEGAYSGYIATFRVLQQLISNDLTQKKLVNLIIDSYLKDKSGSSLAETAKFYESLFKKRYFDDPSNVDSKYKKQTVAIVFIFLVVFSNKLSVECFFPDKSPQEKQLEIHHASRFYSYAVVNMLNLFFLKNSYMAFDFIVNSLGRLTKIIIDQLANKNKKPLLYRSAKRGQSIIVTSLLKVGMAQDIFFKTDLGTTPLLIAIFYGHTEVVRCFLEHDKNLVNYTMDDCTTPLYIAAQLGHLDIVKLLCDFGADVNASRRSLATPLYIAVKTRHKDVVEYLLAKNPDVNAALITGDTPLHAAIEENDTDIATLLISAGADPNYQNQAGETPIDFALKKISIMLLQCLLPSKSEREVEDIIQRWRMQHKRATPENGMPALALSTTGLYATPSASLSLDTPAYSEQTDNQRIRQRTATSCQSDLPKPSPSIGFFSMSEVKEPHLDIRVNQRISAIVPRKQSKLFGEHLEVIRCIDVGGHVSYAFRVLNRASISESAQVGLESRMRALFENQRIHVGSCIEVSGFIDELVLKSKDLADSLLKIIGFDLSLAPESLSLPGEEVLATTSAEDEASSAATSRGAPGGVPFN